MNKKLFKRPPVEYGIYPIIHSGINTGEKTPESFLSKGFAGAVVNIPYGEGYPDDNGEWEKMAKGCHAFMSLGMKLWIYDEKGYPSGTAGGAVLERNPEYECLGLICYDYWRTLSGPLKYRADIPEGKLFKALLCSDDGKEIIDISKTVNDRGTLYFDIPDGSYRLLVLTVRRLFDGTHAAHSYSEPRRYINLFDKKATEAFLEVTHEKYAMVLKEHFNKGIRAFFTDEPSLISMNIPPVSYPMISWREDFPECFIQKYGYPVENAIVALLKGNGPGYVKKKCDFQEFISDELAEGYFGTIQQWCHEHGIPSSGHLLQEEELYMHVLCYGSYYRSAKKLDWPGIDQLESEPFELMNPHSFKASNPNRKNNADYIIPIARLAASIADVYDKKEVFTEASDHWSRMAGRRIRMEWIRASMNWHYALGCNNVTSYFGLDHFLDSELRELNLYVSRLGLLLREGVRDSNAAVYYPEASIWASCVPDGDSFSQNQPEKAMEVQNVFGRLSWELLYRQVDFDYIDDEVIKDGKPENGHLAFKTRRYETVILPECYVMSRKLINRLTVFMDNGVKVIAIGNAPVIDRDTGETGDFMSLMSPYEKTGCFVHCRNIEEWLIDTPLISRTIILEAPASESHDEKAQGNNVNKDILSHSRKTKEGITVFLANMGIDTWKGSLFINKEYSEILIANPQNGNISTADEIPVSKKNIEIEIPPYEGLFILCKQKNRE